MVVNDSFVGVDVAWLLGVLWLICVFFRELAFGGLIFYFGIFLVALGILCLFWMAFVYFMSV